MEDVVLVTGGAGYIGSHVCKALAEAGRIPVCYDTMEKGHAWAVNWGPLELGDIGDVVRLGEVLECYRPSAIVHMAGYIEVGESVRQPERYLFNNAAKSEVLVEAALKYDVGAFVFSSTCAVYGVPQTRLLAETHPISPINPYAKSKARVENCLAAAAVRGLHSMSLRYFNAAGADAGGTIGEAHDPESHLLPLVADALLDLGPPLTLLGTDYDTPDGTCVRDYVHVTDLADAHLRAIGRLEQGRQRGKGRHEAVNLGSGSGYSVQEVLNEAGKIAGKAVPYSVGPRRTGDSPRLVGDIALARQRLGWIPHRNLAKQIEDTLRWRKSMRR